MLDPHSVLGAIVAHKSEEVAARQAALSLAELQARAAPTTRSLRAALAQPGARFVMEVKRASPSEGAIRPDLDARAVARAYLGAADAVSVLTDSRFFGGSFDDLRAVRQEVETPVLCKDFVLSPYQVTEARAYGADAVLLMLSVLDNATAAACLAEARTLGMDCLVEVHDEAEMRRALALPAPLIGINNRDLKTLAVDLAVTERLAPMVPADRTLVAESGIGGRADVRRLASHADAFLVGSSLMRAPDIRGAGRDLVFGRAKICGVTAEADMAVARDRGASFAGLIFVDESPRRMAPGRAVALAAAAEDLPLVGVFRNAPAERVSDMTAHLRLAAVQLHGDEDAAYVADLRRRLPETCEIWAVAPVGESARPAVEGADRTLFDTLADGRSGGTGRAFAWDRVGARTDLRTGLVAGGLNPTNVAAARDLGAWAVDIGSGVEAAPGVKSHEKLKSLFDSLRGPARQKEAA